MSRPTHIVWREGGAEFVRPKGYDPANLTPIPPGIDPERCIVDPVTRTLRHDPEPPEARQRRRDAERWIAAMPEGAIDLLADRVAEKLKGRKHG